MPAETPLPPSHEPEKKPVDIHLEITAREELYTRIRELARNQMKDYYERFPDRIGDQRMKDAISHSYFGLDLIITLMDEYDIEFKHNERLGDAPPRPPLPKLP